MKLLLAGAGFGFVWGALAIQCGAPILLISCIGMTLSVISLWVRV